MLISTKTIHSALELRDYILSVLDAQTKNKLERPISFFRLTATQRGDFADVLLTLHVGYWDKKAGRTLPDAVELFSDPQLTMLCNVLSEFVQTWQHRRVEGRESNPDTSTFDVDCFKVPKP